MDRAFPVERSRRGVVGATESDRRVDIRHGTGAEQ